MSTQIDEVVLELHRLFSAEWSIASVNKALEQPGPIHSYRISEDGQPDKVVGIALFTLTDVLTILGIFAADHIEKPNIHMSLMDMVQHTAREHNCPRLYYLLPRELELFTDSSVTCEERGKIKVYCLPLR